LPARSNDYFRTPCITNLLNSLSDLFFLISISFKASLPTKYLVSDGTFLDVMVFKMTLATSIAGKPFLNLGLNPAILFSVISVYGELWSAVVLVQTFFPIFKLFQN
jgi:hypothetical protein